MENKKYDVFISYSRADLEFVKRLEGELNSDGITCRVDYTDIGYGEIITDQIVSAIKKAIEDAKIIICVISHNTKNGGHIEKEIYMTRRYGAKFILPIYLDNAKPSDNLEYLLTPYNSIHIGKDSELSSLIDTVLTMLGKNAWVFVSHSNKDFNKIISLRNKLEVRHYKPLLFFLKCLDDDKEIYANRACDYTFPIVIPEEAFANWELFRGLQNLDRIKIMTYLLNSEKKSEAIRSFESDQERAIALVKHFIELDNRVNNS